MKTNRNWTMKIRDQERRTATPRVDNFVATMPSLHLDPADFVNDEAVERVIEHLRDHMIGWAEFCRELERELNRSIPKEWQ